MTRRNHSREHLKMFVAFLDIFLYLFSWRTKSLELILPSSIFCTVNLNSQDSHSYQNLHSQQPPSTRFHKLTSPDPHRPPRPHNPTHHSPKSNILRSLLKSLLSPPNSLLRPNPLSNPFTQRNHHLNPPHAQKTARQLRLMGDPISPSTTMQKSRRRRHFPH